MGKNNLRKTPSKLDNFEDNGYFHMCQYWRYMKKQQHEPISANLDPFQKATQSEMDPIVIAQIKKILRNNHIGNHPWSLLKNLHVQVHITFWRWKNIFDSLLIFEIGACISFWLISPVWEVRSNHKTGPKQTRGTPSLRPVHDPPITGTHVRNRKNKCCLQTFDGQWQCIIKNEISQWCFTINIFVKKTTNTWNNGTCFNRPKFNYYNNTISSWSLPLWLYMNAQKTSSCESLTDISM